MGGISYTSNRYSKASNRYSNFYDPKKGSKRILHLDGNDLYDNAISKFLPTSEFKWIYPKKFNLNKYTSYSSKGCLLEVDLEYPRKL